jgi:hypothetical protein
MAYNPVMTPKLFSRSEARGVGLMAGAALLLTLTGCVGYAERSQSRYGYGTRAVGSAPWIEQDDYVYYPSYQIYYGHRSHQYYYQEGSSWVARPAPLNLSVNVLLASPSIAMDFHDGPPLHHAQVIRAYPTNWHDSGRHNGRGDGHGKKPRYQDDQRDDDRR